MGGVLDAQCREIFVKAVCAKGRGVAEQVHTLSAGNGVLDVLGCRVVDLRWSARFREDFVRISGEYQVQAWVAFDEDSELIRQRVEFREDIGIREIGEGCLESEPEVLVDVLSGPTVTDCSVNKYGEVEVAVSVEFRVDVVGRTRLLVRTCRPEEAADARAAGVIDKEWDWMEDGDDPV